MKESDPWFVYCVGATPDKTFDGYSIERSHERMEKGSQTGDLIGIYIRGLPPMNFKGHVLMRYGNEANESLLCGRVKSFRAEVYVWRTVKNPFPLFFMHFLFSFSLFFFCRQFDDDIRYAFL